MVLDHNGALYVVDTLENNIRKLAPAGTNWVATTIAGSGAGISGVADGQIKMRCSINRPALR